MKLTGQQSVRRGNAYAASVTKKLNKPKSKLTAAHHKMVSKLLGLVTKKQKEVIDQHAAGGAAAVQKHFEAQGRKIKSATYVGDSPAAAGKADAKLDFLDPGPTDQLEIKYLNLSKTGKKRRSSERNSSVASISREAGFDHEILRKAEAEHKRNMANLGYSLGNISQSHREYKDHKASKSPVFNTPAQDIERSNRRFRESIAYGLHWHLKSMSSDELHHFLVKHLNHGVDGTLHRLTTTIPTPDGRGEVEHHITNPIEDLKKVLDYHKGWLGTSELNQNSTKIHIYGKSDQTTNKPVKLFTFDVVGKGRPTTPPGVVTSSRVAEEAVRIDGKKILSKRVVKYGGGQENFITRVKKQRRT